MIISVARSSPRHTREPTRSPGLARRGQLIFLDVVRIASWISGTSVPLKKGPSARGLLAEGNRCELRGLALMRCATAATNLLAAWPLRAPLRRTTRPLCFVRGQNKPSVGVLLHRREPRDCLFVLLIYVFITMWVFGAGLF